MKSQVNSYIAKKLGISEYALFPSLDLQGRMGHTGYIDFLKLNDLTDPVMVGIDNYNRPFIAMKCMYGNTPDILVVFQRYVGDTRTWVNCSNILDDRYMREDYWLIVSNIVKGQGVYALKPYKRVDSYKDIQIIAY